MIDPEIAEKARLLFAVLQREKHRAYLGNAMKYFRATEETQMVADCAIIGRWIEGKQVPIDALSDLASRAFFGTPAPVRSMTITCNGGGNFKGYGGQPQEAIRLLYAVFADMGFNVQVPEKLLAVYYRSF